LFCYLSIAKKEKEKESLTSLRKRQYARIGQFLEKTQMISIFLLLIAQKESSTISPSRQKGRKKSGSIVGNLAT
jgi:hypothetical protein